MTMQCNTQTIKKVFITTAALGRGMEEHDETAATGIIYLPPQDPKKS